MIQKRIFMIITAIMAIASLALALPADAYDENIICAIYLTGIGCPNCAYTDSVLLNNFTSKYPNLVIIEYEIYKKGEFNQDTANSYFSSYLKDTRPGVPFLIFSEGVTALGRYQVAGADSIIEEMQSNPCPLPDGSSKKFSEIDFAEMGGKITIWSKDRAIVQKGIGGDSSIIKKLATESDISSIVKTENLKKISPEPVPISESEINFMNGAETEGWSVMWVKTTNSEEPGKEEHDYSQIAILLVVIAFALIIARKTIPVKIAKEKTDEKAKEKKSQKSNGIKLTPRSRDYMLVLSGALFIIAFFILAQGVPQDFLEKAGYSLPLPVFTLMIALIDGFNPCNIFVLTFLLGFLTSASHSRKRIYIVGFTFVAVVYIIYFIFMAFWLNVFKYIGFMDPLRIAIALIAIIAGIINVKELLFFRKGITLMIQEQHKKPLMARIEKMDYMIKKGTLPALILSSIVLATFASLVELPCTAGFPIIYTAILSGKFMATTIEYYAYLALYNLIYVIPLGVIILIFGWSFRGKEINKRQMQYIKFIGGLIMILLGIILLVNPAIIGMGIGA